MEKDMINEREAKEIEILEFRANGNSYGINVKDIREILAYNRKVTPILNAHPFIEGIIMPRDFVITIIDFNQCIKSDIVDEDKNEMIINTRFDDLNIAIHVDSVLGIQKYDEADITAYSKDEEHSEFVTGYLLVGEKKIELVDYKALFRFINPALNLT